MTDGLFIVKIRLLTNHMNSHSKSVNIRILKCVFTCGRVRSSRGDAV